MPRKERQLETEKKKRTDPNKYADEITRSRQPKNEETIV